MNLSLRILGVIVLSVSFLLMTVVCHAKPSEDIIKQAIAEECYKKMGYSGYNIDIKIKKIGDYESKAKYYPVYADIVFWVPGTRMVMAGIDYFKLYMNASDNWKAELVENKRESFIEFNTDTVASAVLEPISSNGYGILIVLTDKGWDEIRQIDPSPGNTILFKVNGQVITKEAAVGSAFPKEFVWTRQTGVNDFTKEEAETLISDITKPSPTKGDVSKDKTKQTEAEILRISDSHCKTVCLRLAEAGIRNDEIQGELSIEGLGGNVQHEMTYPTKFQGTVTDPTKVATFGLKNTQQGDRVDIQILSATEPLVRLTHMNTSENVVAQLDAKDVNTTSKPINNQKNNSESQTSNEKQPKPKESAAPSLKITVLEEKKTGKVPVEGAGVYLDGKEIGTTDKAGELFIKETIEDYHILEVKKSGYFTFKENIEISEYAEDKTVILNPGISDDGGEEVSPTQVQVAGTPVQAPEPPGQDVVLWKISVMKVAGKKKLPVKGAEIFIDDTSFGETDSEGTLEKEVNVGKHILKVESKGFQPFTEELEISKDTAIKEIVLKWVPSGETTDPGKKPVESPTQQEGKKTVKPVLKISVLADTGLERVPVRGAKILMNGYLCGETDKDGVFTKRERMGEHTLRVEKNGFYPVGQQIEFNEHSDSYEIVLKKMPGKR